MLDSLKSTKDAINVHNIRFYNLSPQSINCISYNSVNHKIALSRSDSTIEIWDVKFAPILEKTIFSESKQKYSIEGISWFGERLFAGNLGGEIIEYDVKNLSHKRQQYVTGNSIWCLDVNSAQRCLAAGTEEGYLNIFDLKDDNLIYKTVFDKQDGRILCCKFSSNGDYIVTGSLDVIRIWSTKTGNAIRKMSTGRIEKKKETIVWAIQVLSDFTIISGDSRGQFTVWDGNNGSQIQSHQVFQKDILALAINEGENILICAGVEPVIRIYCLTQITKNNQNYKRWFKFLQRHVHDHDVKAITFAGSKIISGGVDGFLGFSSYSKVHQEIKKYGPFLQNPSICVAENTRQILLRYTNYLEIWKLGNAVENTAEKLLEMKAKNGDYILCCALSPNGEWLAYSTASNIRLFLLHYENNIFNVSKIKVLSKNFLPSYKMLFSQNSHQLYLFNQKKIDVFGIDKYKKINFLQKLEFSKQIEEVISIALISKDENFLVLGSTCKKICVWQKVDDKWIYHLTLPKYFAPLCAMQIHTFLPKLVAIFSDGKIFQYDILLKKFINSKILLENDFTMDCIKNILLYDKDDDKFLLQSENQILSCQWSNDFDENENKKSRTDLIDSKENKSLRINLRRSYDNIIETKWLSKNEIVLVGVNPVSLIEVLPNAFKRKVFGAS